MQNFLTFLAEAKTKKKKVKPSKACFMQNSSGSSQSNQDNNTDNNITNIDTDDSSCSSNISEDEAATAGSSAPTSTQATTGDGMTTDEILGQFDNSLNGITKKDKNFYIPKNVLGKKRVLKRYTK